MYNTHRAMDDAVAMERLFTSMPLMPNLEWLTDLLFALASMMWSLYRLPPVDSQSKKNNIGNSSEGRPSTFADISSHSLILFSSSNG